MTVQPAIADFDSRAFRDALARFATGVALITAPSTRGPVGILVNSFASVSLDPPLVLWSIANNSKRKPTFTAGLQSAIHILTAQQQEHCIGFTKDAHAFDGLTMAENGDGPPLVEECLARFECTHHASHLAGDHTIIISRVTHVTHADGDPLVFHNGTFGRLP